MSDLDDFLKKAAERRKQRQSSTAGSSPAPSRPAPIPRLEPEIIEAEVIEPGIFPKREVVHSTLPSKNHLAEVVDQADEKMQKHVKDVFEHRVGHIRSKSPSTPTPTRPSQSAFSNEETAVIRAAENTVGKDVLKMLKHPQALRAAFIASEIFKRKF